MRLTVLIAHHPAQKWRTETFNRLKDNLNRQIAVKQEDYTMTGGRAWSDEMPVDFIWDNRDKISIGEKRNALIAQAVKFQHEPGYVAFVDDDDRVPNRYVPLLLEGIATDPDCCSLRGIITDDGTNARKFIHSLKYDSWFEKDGIYYRPPNHLNCIRTSIASQFKFPETSHGEDKDWSMQLQKSGLLRTEFEIKEVLYYYEYRSKK